MANDDLESWEHYFYYMYLEARGPQLIFGTDEEIAEAAEADPDYIFFMSQEEIYPMWIHVEGVWYRVGPQFDDEAWRYYYVKYFDDEPPSLLICAREVDIAEFATNNKRLIVFGTNEALDPDHTLVARSTMARQNPTE